MFSVHFFIVKSWVLSFSSEVSQCLPRNRSTRCQQREARKILMSWQCNTCRGKIISVIIKHSLPTARAQPLYQSITTQNLTVDCLEVFILNRVLFSFVCLAGYQHFLVGLTTVQLVSWFKRNSREFWHFKLTPLCCSNNSTKVSSRDSGLTIRLLRSRTCMDWSRRGAPGWCRCCWISARRRWWSWGSRYRESGKWLHFDWNIKFRVKLEQLLNFRYLIDFSKLFNKSRGNE